MKFPATAILGLVVLVLVCACGTFAADVDSPAPPSSAASAMYSLEAVYNRLDTGAPGAKRTGAFTEPSSGPSATRHTLNDVMAKAPAEDAAGASASQVLSGKAYWGLLSGEWGARMGTMANNGAVTLTPGTADIQIALGYHDGTGVVKGDANLAAGNITSGVQIFNVTGTALVATGDAAAGNVLTGKTFSNATAVGVSGTMPNNGAVTVTPGTSDQTIPAGFHNGSGKVVGDANLTAPNIKAGTAIFGVTGTAALATGTATADQVLDGATFSNSSGAATGTRPIAPVEKTGQTTVYAANDDGALQKGVALPSPRFTDNGNGTVTDNLTQLIWLKDANAFLSRTWAQALTDCAGLANGSGGLTDNSVAGDWRLPNVKELHSLVNYAYLPIRSGQHGATPCIMGWDATYGGCGPDTRRIEMTTVREWLTAMLDVHINCLWAVGLSAVVSAIIGYKWSANKLREANRRINVENLPLGGGPDGGMRL